MLLTRAASPVLAAARPSAGSDAYHASAVHIDNSVPSSVYMSCPSLTATDNGYFGFSVWVKATTFVPYGVLFQVDPLGDFLSALTGSGGPDEILFFDLKNQNEDEVDVVGYYDASAITSVWVCLIGAVQTNLSSGNKIMKLYAGDTPLNLIGDIGDANPSFNIQFNGLPIYLFDDTFGDSFTGDVADFRIMPGINLLTAGDIAEVTRRLFIDADGKPVNPAVATAALGNAGAVLLSGNASTFATNQGTGGAFTVTGALTNASTSPSD